MVSLRIHKGGGLRGGNESDGKITNWSNAFR